MKKLIIILLCILGLWQHFSKKNDSTTTVPLPFDSDFIPAKTLSNFECDGRQHCSQMTSYEEAKYFLENCPDTKMDGDRDGIPCERQF